MSDTAKFCGYCGKPLENGICTCDRFTDKVNPLKKPEKERNFNLSIASYITNPIAASIKQGNENKITVPLCLGLIHLIIVYSCVMIVTEFNPLALIATGMTGAANLSAAAASWLFGKISGCDSKFTNYLAKYCIATVPSTVFAILSCASFFLLWPCCIVFLILSIVSWITSSAIFLRETYGVRETVVFWNYIGISAIVILVLIALGVFLHKHILSTIAGTNLIQLFI